MHSNSNIDFQVPFKKKSSEKLLQYFCFSAPLPYKVSQQLSPTKKNIYISPPTESAQPASIIPRTSVGHHQAGVSTKTKNPSLLLQTRRRRSSSGAPSQALHGPQEGAQGLVLLQRGAVLLLLLDDAALHAAEAGLALPGPADASRGQRLGELFHHQRQQMGGERVHAGCHAWTVAETGVGGDAARGI